MKYKDLSLVGPFTKIARIMAGNFDVQVIPSGTKCATDGNRIFIPFTADYLDASARHVLNGHLDHELCHVIEEREHKKAGRPTPLDLLNMIRHESKEGQIIALLCNAFEDIRCETKYGRQYPGMGENLAAKNEHLINVFRARPETDRMRASFWGELACGIIAMSMEHPGDWIRADVRPYLDLITDEIAQAKRIVWASDSLELARAVHSKVREAAKKAVEPPKPEPEAEEPEAEEPEAEEPEAEEPDTEEPDTEEPEAEEPDTEEPKADTEEPEAEEPEAEEPEAEEPDTEEPKADTEEPEAEEPEADTEEPEAEEDDEDLAEEEPEAEEDDEDLAEEEPEAEEPSDDMAEEPNEADDANLADGDGTAEGIEGDGVGDDSGDGGDTELPVASDAGFEPIDFLGGAGGALDDGAPTDDIFTIAKDDMERIVRDDIHAHNRYLPNPDALKLDKFVDAEYDRNLGESREHARQRAIDNYNKAFEEISSQVGALRGRQQAILQTMTRTRILPGLDAGALDDSVLANVRCGDRSVFTDRSRKMQIDTAIEVLVDLSGSMGSGDRNGCCAYYAKRTTIALAESWEALRVPYEVIGFYNDQMCSGGPFGWIRSPIDTVARAPFVYLVFKGWGEKLAQCRERFVALRGYQQNADGEAVMAAATRLAQRKESRRILVVISDGAPCHPPVPTHILESNLKDSITTITRAGIEVWGIGAGTSAPARYYNEKTGAKNIIIRDLTKLAPTLFQALRDRLLVRAS